RTISPFSPEGLSIYPKRLATNRPNPYRVRDGLSALATGLASFETRQCASGPRPQPNLPPDLASIVGGLSPNAAQQILQPGFPAHPATVPAPPCRAQGPIPGFGTDYPHVLAQPPGANASP